MTGLSLWWQPAVADARVPNATDSGYALWQPRAVPALPADQAGLLCRRAVQAAGRAAGIPEHLMSAIGRVESGRRGPDGLVHPWPWSINAEGTDHIYDSKAEAIAAVRAFQAEGMRSIDVGCMQVNLLHHPTAFASLEQALDPVINAAYAAHFLRELYAQTGTWEKATADYHSANPELGTPYQQKVMAALPEETRSDQALGGPASGGFAAMRPSGSAGFRATAGTIIRTSHGETGRILPLATQASGRLGLDFYRARPVRLAPLRLAAQVAGDAR